MAWKSHVAAGVCLLVGLELTLFVVVNLTKGDFMGRVGVGPVDLLTLLYFPIIIGLFLLARALAGKRTTSDSERYAIAGLAVTLVFCSALAYLADALDKASVVVLVSIYAATCGWIFTSYVSTRNAKKAHTFGVLLQIRNSAEFNDCRRVLKTRFLNDGVPINRLSIKAAQELEKDSKVDIRESVLYVLNYYEFICAGVLSGDLDRNLVRLTLRSIIRNVYSAFQNFIDEEKVDYDGKVNESYFENIRKVNDMIAAKRL